MNEVETLRAAARIVREAAAQATPGEREVAYLAGIGQCVRTADFSFCVTVERGMEGDAEWIALASPALAPTIVACLEGAANDLASALNAYPFADEECDPEELLDLCDEPDSVRHALALAALITGQDPA